MNPVVNQTPAPVDAPETNNVRAIEELPKKQTDEQGTGFKAGADHFDSSLLWVGLFLIAIVVVMGLSLFWLVQCLDKLDRYPALSWLKPLLHRFKIMLFGPESVKDSKNFVDALEIWHALIAQNNPTPRSVKAFVNRLRYIASRGDNLADTRREAHLVALAAIYYCYERNIDEVQNSMTDYLADEPRPSQNQFEQRWPALALALGEHFQAFGAYPSPQDIAFYQAMNADICIHRQD